MKLLLKICIITAYLILSLSHLYSQDLDYSNTYRYTEVDKKVIGKSGNSYYVIAGLKNGNENGLLLKQDYFSFYQPKPQHPISLDQQQNSLTLEKYNDRLSLEEEIKITPSKPYQMVLDIDLYQNLMWLYYAREEGNKTMIYGEKFSLSGESIFVKKIAQFNGGLKKPPYLIAAYEAQKILILKDKQYQILSLRFEGSHSGKLSADKIEDINLDKEGNIIYLDHASVNGKHEISIVKYFPRIDHANRMSLYTNGSLAFGSYDNSKLPNRLNVLIFVCNDKKPHEYRFFEIDVKTFKTITQNSGFLDDEIMRKLKPAEGDGRYYITDLLSSGNSVFAICEYRDYTFNEESKQTEHFHGKILLAQIPFEGNAVANMLKRYDFASIDRSYNSYGLFEKDRDVYLFFNGTKHQGSTGLHMARIDNNIEVEVQKLLRPKEGGIIMAPRFLQATGEQEVLMYGVEEDRFRLVKVTLD